MTMSKNSLTARETEILALAAAGKSDRDIGAALNLSTHTINTHFRNIFKKLGALNRVHAVAKALTAGIISLSE
jgi:DNA-binding CsgD family transcriptional regulator